jgi:hypothetical protein
VNHKKSEGNGTFTIVHQVIDETGNVRIVEFRSGKRILFLVLPFSYCESFSCYFFGLLLRILTFSACGRQHRMYRVRHGRDGSGRPQVLDPAAPDKHYGVLLQVMSITRDVCVDLLLVVSLTQATFLMAELGFFGVVVYTRTHTPLRCGMSQEQVPCSCLQASCGLSN